MVERRPLVIKNGQIQQLQSGDTICGIVEDCTIPLISGGNAVSIGESINGGNASSVSTHTLNGGSASA